MAEEISWKKELEMAEYNANSGDMDKESVERCLRYAKEKASREGVDISKEVERIRKIWRGE